MPFLSFIFKSYLDEKKFIVAVTDYFSIHVNICTQKSRKRTYPGIDPVTTPSATSYYCHKSILYQKINLGAIYMRADDNNFFPAFTFRLFQAGRGRQT